MSDIAKVALIATVLMIRSSEEYPEGPHSADVHPDEVGNYSAAGWIVADPDAAPPPPPVELVQTVEAAADAAQAMTNAGTPPVAEDDAGEGQKTDAAAVTTFPADVNLDDMSAKELRAFAEKHDIAVSPNPATSADKLRKVIREAFAEVTKTMEGDPNGRI